MSADFERFWSMVDADLARYPMAPDLQPLPMRSTDAFTTYALRLTSTGPYRIFGYYSVPRAREPFPALLQTPRYGSVNHVPDYHDRERYAVLQLAHRGQRLADQPFAAAYPGLLTLGIEAPERYVYRAIVADCLRGAEFLASRPEVDQTRVGIQGDDLALLTAARRPRFAALQVSAPLLYRLLETADATDAYPTEEVNDYLRSQPSARAAIARTLEYFDAQRHAPSVRATTLLAGNGTWPQTLRDALGGPTEIYELTHRGAVDSEWLDGWLAQHLGAEPRARFRARA